MLFILGILETNIMIIFGFCWLEKMRLFYFMCVIKTDIYFPKIKFIFGELYVYFIIYKLIKVNTFLVHIELLPNGFYN